jgi:hypothetical protein
MYASNFSNLHEVRMQIYGKFIRTLNDKMKEKGLIIT